MDSTKKAALIRAREISHDRLRFVIGGQLVRIERLEKHGWFDLLGDRKPYDMIRIVFLRSKDGLEVWQDCKNAAHVPAVGDLIWKGNDRRIYFDGGQNWLQGYGQIYSQRQLDQHQQMRDGAEARRQQKFLNA